MKDDESTFNLGMKAHYILSNLTISEQLAQTLDLESLNYINTLQAKYNSLYFALKGISKNHKTWIKNDFAYELVYGKKVKGRRSGSITLEQKVKDYYYVSYFKEKNKSSVSDAIDEYLKKLNLSDREFDNKLSQTRKHFYEIKNYLNEFKSKLK